MRRSMTRSLGDQLPDALSQLLDGSDLASREGLTFLLLTTDAAGWPHMAMLSVGELVAMDQRTLRARLWQNSSKSNNLTRAGRAMLTFIAIGKCYYVLMTVSSGLD